MLPALVACQIQDELEHFLRTTFQSQDTTFAQFFHDFFRHGKLFAGPYISLGLPLSPEPLPEGVLTIAPGFDPYTHQRQAFQRLAGSNARSTIVATGTGSGKTESFLYPILDYCHAQIGSPGIKAILIYPMNALANDQAERIAQTIAGDDRLRGKVRAGLYTGDQPGRHPVMGENHLITDHKTLQTNPPDILLTNYRMLDLLLLRPDRARLWQNTTADSLQYLVVDELHTFDGAQGTDLAILIRRLKSRLDIPEGRLTCVGTSATIGSNPAPLQDYARRIFGEAFDDESIITETAQSVAEFFADSAALPDERVLYTELLPAYSSGELEPNSSHSVTEYISRQAMLWFDAAPQNPDSPDWKHELGETLTKSEPFRRLVQAAASQPRTIDELAAELTGKPADRHSQLMVISLLSLASWARNTADGPAKPLLRVNVQLWARELRRIVAPVSAHPVVRFWDDLNEEERGCHLPVVHCRDCNSSGWVSYRHDTTSHRLETDYAGMRDRYFKNSPETVFLFPPEDEYEEHGREGTLQRYCSECLTTVGGEARRCSVCGNDDESRFINLELFHPVTTNRHGIRKVYHNCPVCGGRDSLMLVGSQSTSMLSVALAQMYASHYTGERKVLSFSDSVQDAAHHAGFFGARTYGFNLRMALTQFLHQNGVAKTLPLSKLTQQFVQFYRNQFQDDERFVSVFLASRLEAHPDFEKLLSAPPDKPGKVTGDMVAIVERRLQWDLHAELLHRSSIGRTVEKSALAICYPDSALVEQAVSSLHAVLTNEFGPLRSLSSAQTSRYARTMLHRLRQYGAVLFDQVKRYFEEKGNAYVLGRNQEEREILPPAGNKTVLPAFLTEQHTFGQRFDRLIAARSSSDTWYQQWAHKSLGIDEGDIVNDVLLRTLKVLYEAGIMEYEELSGHKVWYLPERVLLVSGKAVRMRCTNANCSSGLTIPTDEQAKWYETPCSRQNCHGHLVGDDSFQTGYYGELYRSGELARVITAEHSALVPSEQRERIEQLFGGKNTADGRPVPHKPWYPNLVSSTPTLEMGIDIGDLSATIQTRVPPRPENYLQRIGRSGRKTGNALALTVASARPHDLYYLKQPLHMIAADIDPPGLFLDAPYVLRRQLLAFAFDSWVKAMGDGVVIPATVREVLDGLFSDRPGLFPATLFAFIRQNAENLLDSFVLQFAGSLTDHAVAYLQEQLDPEAPELITEMEQAFVNLQQEIVSLTERLHKVSQKLSELEQQPHRDSNDEEELAQNRKDRTALEAIVRDLRGRLTFQFLTDEGLLPNFTFPETGVVLRSVIIRKAPKDAEPGDKGPPPLVMEYQRPASAALSELAPEAEFYGQGRRVTIKEIDLRTSEIEEWRICDSCDYMQVEATARDHQHCPRCGSEDWDDTGQKTKLVKMRQVVAVESDDKSRFYDETEERAPAIYTRNLFVDIDRDQIEMSYSLDEERMPFGFEFIRQVTFRDLNFGKPNPDCSTTKFAGLEVKTNGFRICKECGTVQPSKSQVDAHDMFATDSRNAREHTSWCPVHTGEKTGDDILRAVYLYREYPSEALRFLVPAAVSEVDRRMESFVAALFLGLKLHFGGKIDHLRSTNMHRTSPTGSDRHFLVLYDTVPGGTGYLNQLLANNTETLRSVFIKSLRWMQACSCEDGCHKCLFSYRQAYAMDKISKQEAIILFDDILQAWGSMSSRNGVSIDSISQDSYAESKLEEAFLEALRIVPERSSVSCTLKRAVVRGRPGYQLYIANRKYEIEPQANLGPSHGVAVPSRPDFLIHPEYGSEVATSIAVFTDGFAYHADAERGRYSLPEDIAKRQALIDSKSYLQWTITYDDVQQFMQSTSGGQAAPLPMSPINQQGVQQQSGKLNLLDVHDAFRRGSMAALVAYLVHPAPIKWKQYAALSSLSLQRSLSAPSEIIQDGWNTASITGMLLAAERSDFSSQVTSLTPFVLGSYPKDDPMLSIATPTGGLNIETEIFKPQHLRAMVILHDEPEQQKSEPFKQIWTSYWTTVNRLQFMPQLRIGSLSSQAVMPAVVSASESQGEIELLELVADQRAAAIISALYAAGCTMPDVGYELSDNKGRVAFEAELAWPDQMIAVLPEDAQEDAAAFRSAGWQTRTLDEHEIIEHLKEVLS